jgi:DNA (cytosine-5)-methyltransferase 1
VLCKHWPGVPKWRDVKDVTARSLSESGITHPIKLLSGGFPCQPFSCAGQRTGKDDPRYLWKEMFRIIKTTKPHWIIGENVTGIIELALDEVGTDLESCGYTWRAFSLSALHANLNFDGERVFIVASSNSRGVERGEPHTSKNEETIRCQHNNTRRIQSLDFIQWQQNKSRPFGVANGVSNRVDRVGCLGNAVVPQQVYPILKAIADIEKGDLK